MPVGTGQGHVRIARDDGRGDRGLIEPARRAVEAALWRRAPATPRPTPPRTPGARSAPTAARSRASPRRPSGGSACAPGSATGSATPSAPTSPRRASRRSPPARPRRRGSPTRTSSPARRASGAPTPIGAKSHRSCSEPGDRRSGRPADASPSSTLAIERAALDADPRVAGGRAGRLRRLRRAGRDRLLDRDRRRVSSAPAATPTCRRWPRATTAARPASASTSAAAPAALDPAAIGREGAERATAMIGAGKPESRSCPVVLDPTVAASFIGLIGGGLSAGAVQRGRSPFAERLGERGRRRGARPPRRRARPRGLRPPRPSTARACPAAAPP